MGLRAYTLYGDQHFFMTVPQNVIKNLLNKKFMVSKPECFPSTLGEYMEYIISTLNGLFNCTSNL